MKRRDLATTLAATLPIDDLEHTVITALAGRKRAAGKEYLAWDPMPDAIKPPNASAIASEQYRGQGNVG